MAYLINVFIYNNSAACLKMVKSEVLPRSHGPIGQHCSPISFAASQSPSEAARPWIRG